jgi:hypothetical protein
MTRSGHRYFLTGYFSLYFYDKKNKQFFEKKTNNGKFCFSNTDPPTLPHFCLLLLFRRKTFSCPFCLCPFKDLRQAFMLFDKDKSGFIEAREIREVTSTLGMPLSRDELEDFMKMADQVSISWIAVSTVKSLWAQIHPRIMENVSQSPKVVSL